MEDSQIVGLYWDRDEAAIEQTQIKYEKYLSKIAYNILADQEDTLESVNDTYLAAWNSMPPHKPDILSTYLGKLTRRISVDLFRKKTSHKRGAGEYALSLEELGDCCTGGDATSQEVEAKLLAEAIAKYLQTQSWEIQHVFVGRYYYMDSVRDIAGYCHISESKVKILLYRARQGLKTWLEREGFVI